MKGLDWTTSLVEGEGEIIAIDSAYIYIPKTSIGVGDGGINALLRFTVRGFFCDDQVSSKFISGSRDVNVMFFSGYTYNLLLMGFQIRLQLEKGK